MNDRLMQACEHASETDESGLPDHGAEYFL
jgi:hypothetical protein